MSEQISPLAAACQSALDASAQMRKAIHEVEDNDGLESLLEPLREVESSNIEIALTTPAVSFADIRAKAELVRDWIEKNEAADALYPEADIFDRLTWSLVNDIGAMNTPCSIDFVAAMEFEPWVSEPDAWAPPAPDKWTSEAMPHLIALRASWNGMFKSKPQLVEMIENIGEDAGIELLDAITAASDYFKGIQAILGSFEMRLMSASAVAAERAQSATQEHAHV